MKGPVVNGVLFMLAIIVTSADEQSWVAISDVNRPDDDLKAVEQGSFVKEPDSQNTGDLAFGNPKNPHTIQMDGPDEAYTGYAADGRPVGHYIYSYQPTADKEQETKKVDVANAGTPFDWASFIAAQKNAPGTQTIAFGDPENPHTAHLDTPEEAYYGYAPDGRPVGHLIYSYQTKQAEKNTTAYKKEPEAKKEPTMKDEPEEKPSYPPKKDVMKEEEIKDPYAKQGSFIDGVAIFIFPMIILISLGLYVPFIEMLSLPTKRSLSGEPSSSINTITEVVLAGVKNPQCLWKLKCLYEARVKAKSWGNSFFTLLEIVAPSDWISRWARRTRESKELSEDYCGAQFATCQRL